jgi:hypothetical protein
MAHELRPESLIISFCAYLQVTDFLKDRNNHDADWEEDAWAKLLNSNQDILVLMQRLFEKNLITQDMIQMATLPTKPPPRQSEADSKAISVATMDVNGVSAEDSAAIPAQGAGSSSMMGGGYGQGYQSPSMMGMFPWLPRTLTIRLCYAYHTVRI